MGCDVKAVLALWNEKGEAEPLIGLVSPFFFYGTIYYTII
jgi:hypothetical protein